LNGFNLKLMILKAYQNAMENDLSSNRIDIAFFYQPILTKNLNIINAFEIKVHAVLPENLPVKNPNGLMFYEIIDQQILLPLKNTQLRNKIDGACAKLGISHFKMNLNNIPTQDISLYPFLLKNWELDMLTLLLHLEG